jgi:tetratricopeptide (TPR) repeat protein
MKFKVFLLALLGYVPASVAQQPAVVPVDSNAIKTLFFAGLRDKLNEDYNRASESFNKIIILDPKNAAVHYEIAVVNYRQNNLFEAEAAIKKATSLDGNNIWYWMLMAELYKRKGNMDAMARVLNQLIRLSPENAGYYFDRSNAYLLAGKTEEAIKGYDELEKKFGTSDELKRARQRITSGGRENQPENTIADAVVNPDQATLLLAEKLYQKGDLNAALAQFKTILQNTDQLFMAWERTTNIQLALGLYQEALKTADAAVAIYPNQAILYYYMAVALQRDHQYDQALSNVKSALGLDAENGIYLELYGDVLFLKGDSVRALVQWKRAKIAGNSSEKLNKKINEQKYLE